MGAGNYPDRLQRLVRSIVKNTDNGQDEESFTPGAYYWCRVEYDIGTADVDYGAEQTGGTVTIHVRNQPTLSALDRLSDGSTTFALDSIRPEGKTELVCEAHYYDDLNT